MNSSTRNISLAMILVTTIIIGLAITYFARTTTVTTRDEVTGQTVVTGQDAPKDEGVISENNYAPSVLSDTKIFDIGMTVNEYQSIIAMMDIYTKKVYGEKKHITYLIDPSSIKYDQTMRMFTFTMKVRDNNSTLKATYQRNDETHVTYVLYSHDKEVFRKAILMEGS